MKKSIKLLCVSLFGALLFSCGNMAADNSKNDSGENPPAPSTDVSYKKPDLPASSGTNPFVGNSYAYGDRKYEFRSNRILIEYGKNSDENKFKPSVEYEYSYNAITQEMSLRWSKLWEDKTLYTVQDYLNMIAADPDLQDEYNEYIEFFEAKQIWRANLDEQNNLILLQEYFNEKPSFEELKEWSTYFKNPNWQEKISVCHLGSSNYVPGVYGYIEGHTSNGHFEYSIKTLTENTIVAESRDNTDDTLTLSYILHEPKEGILSITLTTTDTPSESYTLETNGPSTYTKVSE